MKKITVFILSLIILMFFAGCSEKKDESVETYKQVAQSLIESGNIDGAIETLEKGIDETGDEELVKMLELISDVPGDAENGGSKGSDGKESGDKKEIPTDSSYFVSFDGFYCSDNASWHYGGKTLQLLGTDSYYHLIYKDYAGADRSGVAEIETDISFTDFDGDSIEFDFVDSCGSTGTFKLTLSQNGNNKSVICELYNVVPDITAEWGVYDGTYELKPGNPKMDYTPEEYAEWEALGFPEYSDGKYINVDADSYYGNNGTDSYYYNESNYGYTAGQITVNPKYVYWNGSTLSAECYIVNGLANTAENISVDSFTIYGMQGGIIASGSFGTLRNLKLEPYSYAVWTLNFSGNSISDMYANLSHITADSTVTYASYDMKTASGILASEGITEQQFREMCFPVLEHYNPFDADVIAKGKEYYQKYPSENTTLYDLTLEWNDYVSGKERDYTSYEYLTMCSSLDEFLDYILYGPKGEAVFLLEFYNEKYLINNWYLLHDVHIELIDNNKYYTDDSIFYDLRENNAAPIVSIGSKYDFYVIYVGLDTSFGDERDAFYIISADDASYANKWENFEFFNLFNYQGVAELEGNKVSAISGYWNSNGDLIIHFTTEFGTDYVNPKIHNYPIDFILKNISVFDSQGNLFATIPEIKLANISYNIDTRSDARYIKIPAGNILIKNAYIQNNFIVTCESAEIIENGN